MKRTKTLVKIAKFTDQQLKGFILEVVNAPDRLVDGSDDYLAQKYRQFFPTRDGDIQILARELAHYEDPNHPDPNNPFDRKEATRMLCRSVMGDLRKSLRMIWQAGNENAAEWRIFRFQARIHGRTGFQDGPKRNLYPPSLNTPIELAIDWVRRNLLMLRVCRNPECLNRFFVADRAQRRFCVECVSASQKAHKRRSWKKRKHLPEEPRMDAGARIVAVKRARGVSPRSEGKLKEFLHDIVNAPEGSFDYILKRYIDAGFLSSKTLSERAVALNPEFLTPEELRSRRRQEMHQGLERLREGLRRIWNADDQYTARWRLFSVQQEIYKSTNPENYDSGEELDPASTADRLVHRAFGCLRQNLHMLRTCGNPNCQRPFFIATKSNQTYCSVDVCALWGQQKAKDHWWKVEGPAWRKRRNLQKMKMRRRSGAGR